MSSDSWKFANVQPIHEKKNRQLKSNFFENYLQNICQRVGTKSDWKTLDAGVPQGSLLGPLLFLVYINDLTDNITSQMRLFSDDAS